MQNPRTIREAAGLTALDIVNEGHFEPSTVDALEGIAAPLAEATIDYLRIVARHDPEFVRRLLELPEPEPEPDEEPEGSSWRTFPERLRARREALGLTRFEACVLVDDERAEMSPGMLYRVESGKGNQFLCQWRAFAEALEVPLEPLPGRAELNALMERFDMRQKDVARYLESWGQSAVSRVSRGLQRVSIEMSLELKSLIEVLTS